MGISHLSILGAHSDVKVVGVCDTSKMVLGALQKYSKFPCYTNYSKMLEETEPEALFIAVPPKFHYEFTKLALEKKIHVFTEKPFCMTPDEGQELAQLARTNKLINQVGYHNKFVGTFREVKRLIDGNYLGKIQHFTGEAYGAVVIKKKTDSWRSNPMEGGGCLMDYASHVVDLINDILAPVVAAKGTALKTLYSTKVDDAVYSLLELETGLKGLLSVNWSDETFRKMSTSITIMGEKGKIVSDANELKVYFKGNDCPKNYTSGWNVKYVTDLAGQVDFYLRGEEYSAQVDSFVKACLGQGANAINTFESAWRTDKALSIIKKNAEVNS